MGTRREFMGWAAAALAGPGLARGARGAGDGPTPPPTGSDVGSLYSFIQSQAVRSDIPLSFLRDEFMDVATWKARARGKLLDLLHYAPPRCEPKAEVVERSDRGDYVRFNAEMQAEAWGWLADWV